MKRSPLEIKIEILRVVSKGETKPTSIMGICNLCFTRQCYLLDQLVNKGFLISGDGADGRSSRSYMLSEEGYEMLDEYDRFMKRFSE